MSNARIGDQEIFRGNCLDVLRRSDFEPADVVVTSPPYNLNLAYGMYDDSRTEKDYVNWIATVAAAIKRMLKPDGSFFLNLSGSSSRPYVPFEVMVKLRNDVGLNESAAQQIVDYLGGAKAAFGMLPTQHDLAMERKISGLRPRYSLQGIHRTRAV